VDVDNFPPTTSDAFASDLDTHDAIQAALRAHVGNSDLEVNKIGLARSIVAVIREVSNNECMLALTNQNFRELFEQLSQRQRKAEHIQGGERISSRINRIKRIFQMNYPSGAKREDVLLLIEEVENQLDSDSPLEADQVRLALRTWVRDFGLDDELDQPVDDWERFRVALDGLAYAGTQAVQDPSVMNIQDGILQEADRGRGGEKVASAGNGSAAETALIEMPLETQSADMAETTEPTAAESSPPEQTVEPPTSEASSQ
jgi:hypothetical protein